jgi:cysteine-rich repeat protein
MISTQTAFRVADGGKILRASRERRIAITRLLATAVICTVAGPAWAVTATVANDVCAPAANPCNVTQKFDVTPGAVLDFGVRSVAVTGSGQFNFGAGNGTILSGNFSAATSGTAIDANNPVTGGTSSGIVTVEARRLCTGGAAELPCTEPSDCQLGSCGVRRCALQPAQVCTGDAACNVGPCGALTKRCMGTASLVRCETSADCNLGSCLAQPTCSGLVYGPHACSTNADCNLGSCTKGTASIEMGGAVAGNSDEPAVLILRATDSVSVTKMIDAASTSPANDGGEIVIDAINGSISVSSKLKATGGSTGTGGTIELTAGTDIVTSEELDVNGGDFDGGTVDFSAGRDVRIMRSIFANSTAGAGYGGELIATADRDVLVTGVSTSSRTILASNGHTDGQGNSGDGGTFTLDAGRNFSLDENSEILSRGAAAHGSGGEVSLGSGASMQLAGDVTAKADGNNGAGGILTLTFGGPLTATAASVFDLSGSAQGGGVLDAAGSGNTTFAGKADLSASAGGEGGGVLFDILADVSISGSMTVKGSSGGGLDLEACRLTLQAPAVLDNQVAGGANRLTSRESMKLLAGSTLKAGAGGTNTLVYRSPAKPPLLQGTVVPAATLLVDETLEGCPVCGNAEVDQTETCDDGNTASGDGCSADCQNENCIAQTPGYPGVPLCDDDDSCTEDICNTNQAGGTCTHLSQQCAICGNGQLETGEACDDGNATFANGEYCAAGCVLVPCGRPTNQSGLNPKTTDALFTLRSAVGQVACSPRVCDVDNNGNVSASDAQRVLRAAVGLPQALVCPMS